MSHNTWILRLAHTCVRPMVNTPITPDHLTGLRLLTGLAASFCLASGDPHWINFGCGLFVLSMVLDRADGELARLSGNISVFGHRFDLWTDAICDSAILLGLGLGIGLRSGPFGDWAMVMGIIAGMSSGIIF